MTSEDITPQAFQEQEIAPKDFFLSVAADESRPRRERVQATLVLQRLALQEIRASGSESPEPPLPPIAA